MKSGSSNSSSSDLGEEDNLGFLASGLLVCLTLLEPKKSAASTDVLLLAL